MDFLVPPFLCKRDRLISRCKNEFTNSRGIIIKFVNGGVDTGDLVKFKNQ